MTCAYQSGKNHLAPFFAETLAAQGLTALLFLSIEGKFVLMAG